MPFSTSNSIDQRLGAAGEGRRRLLRAAGLVTVAGCVPGIVRPVRAAVSAGPVFVPHGTRAALDAAGAVHALEAELSITAPRRANDAGVVPVSVTSAMAGTRELWVVIDPNPIPVAARVRIPDGTEPQVSLRVRLADSGRLYAVARTDRGLYWAACETEVAENGCA